MFARFLLGVLIAAPPNVDVRGFIDGVFAWNANRPADHLNFIPGSGTSAHRDDEFSINLAQVDLVVEPKPLGIHLALGWGTAMDVVHAAEADTWRNVVQASIQYQTTLGRGLLVEAGVYPCPVGFESFASKDNGNYTRSWLAELSPYYQAGVKLAYPFGPRWSGQLHVVNGWQVIADNNRGKTVGWQLAYAGDRVTFAFNGLAGPELANDDRDTRVFLDTVFTHKVTPSWSLGASVDAAREERPAGGSSRWNGAALYARFAPAGSKSAGALRVESFDDRDGAISGTAQRLSEATLTFEHRPVETLILKLEGRVDRSSRPVFATGERRQFLGLVSAVALF